MDVRGSCLCGSVAWVSSGGFSLMTHCHCAMCRKAHGSAFATWAATPTAGLRWLRGHDAVSRYESSSQIVRTFCSRCGSVVPLDPEGERTFVPMGCLDDDPGARPEAHIFAAHKAPWHEIRDALPRFAAYPEGFGGSEVPGPKVAPPEPGSVAGSCLCGAVRFAVAGELSTIVDCHCTRCRKAHASAFGANLWAGAEQLRWIAGRDRVARFDVPGARSFSNHFCRVCGSLTPRPVAGGKHVVIPAGALDGDPGARERMHIHTDSKAPWFEISDALPRFPGKPPMTDGAPSTG